MDFIDLHTHSIYSDGTMTPAELLSYAKKKTLKAVALTDHDTIDGLREAGLAAKANDIEFINGIELAANYKNVEIHLLGYFIDYENNILTESLAYLKDIRSKRNLKIADKLMELGIYVDYDVLESYTEGGMLTRTHFAKYLFDKGVVKSTRDAFDVYLDIGRAAYVSRDIFNPKECINIIEAAGGKAYLAHPLLYGFDKDALTELIEELKSYNLAGIEGIYSLNTEADDVILAKMAKNYELNISGGSDFHGDNKPYIDLGVGRGRLHIPYCVLTKMKDSITDSTN